MESIFLPPHTLQKNSVGGSITNYQQGEKFPGSRQARAGPGGQGGHVPLRPVLIKGFS